MSTSPDSGHAGFRKQIRRAGKTALAHPIAASLVAGLILLLLVNAVAFAHAWRMTHFVEHGTRTGNPETLGWIDRLRVVMTGVVIPRPKNNRSPDSVGLSFTELRLSARDGTRLAAWFIPRETSSGTVVLCHGYAARKSDLLDEAREFHGMGFQCLLLDFRGSGGSDGHATSIGYHEALDVAAAWSEAKNRSRQKPVLLFGQSMGSAAILRAIAQEGVTPDGMILECPFGRLTDTVGNRFRTMGVPAFPLSQLLVFWGGIQNGFWAFGHNPAEYAARVSCPVLLFAGNRDLRVRTGETEEISGAMGIHVRLVWFDAGHMPFLKANPAKWDTEVRRFVEGFRPPPAGKSANP